MIIGDHGSNERDRTFDRDGFVPSNRPAKAELLAYLAHLGLGDADVAKVLSLVPASPLASSVVREDVMEGVSLNPRLKEDLLEALEGVDLLETAPLKETITETAPPVRQAARGVQRTVKLYMAEEQELLRQAYLSFLTDQPSIELAGYSGDLSVDALVRVTAESQPDVLLLGVKRVNADIGSTLASIREAMPRMGLILLFAYCDAQGIKALRKFSNGDSVGCAYMLKHTIDTPEQFTEVVQAVAQGRIIMDPTVMEGLIKSEDSGLGVLPGLSPREMEVLSWIAKGYRNNTIARVLSRDLRTVERHINSIYGKLQVDDDSKDPRVNAALMFLNAAGSFTP